MESNQKNGVVKKQKNLELKKHVGVIHSSNSVTLLQKKIANALLYNAYDDLQIKAEYQITIKDLCALIGYDSNDSKTIKKALVALLSTVVQWNLIDKNAIDTEGVWNASSIIADASINGSICTYSYSNRMRGLLHHPAMYGRLNMIVQAKFKSGYGLALYENCIRFQNLSSTPWIEFDVFRKLMGVEEKKYLIFRDFKRRVLDPAVSEVNKYAPILVKYELQKNQRKTSSIRFLIEKRRHIQKSEDSEEVISSNRCLNKLKFDFGFSNKQATETIVNYGENYIFEKIAIIESSQSFINGKILNLAKYLQDALAKDYQLPKSSKEVMYKVNAEFQEKEKEEKKRNKLLQDMKDKYRTYREEQIVNIFRTLDIKEQENISKYFEEDIKNTAYMNIYLKEGLDNFLIKKDFLRFARERNLDILNKLMSFQEFSKTNEAG
jgi:plasmid replication initiation protein